MTIARAVVPNREPLAATPLIRLPIGSVRADGWLLRQLELQKDGLTGAAEQMYDALTIDSAWLGGKGEAWEKGPYYVKGLIALAHTLDDAELKQRAQKWIDWAINSQRDDGFFGPASNDDWWPRMVVLFYLVDHYEATGDPRVIPFLTKYFRHQLAALPSRPLRDWGRSRAGDNIDAVLWTYNRTGEPFLLDLARLLHEQAYPWTGIFTHNRFYDFGEDFQPQHIVNVSQALKFPAVSWQFTRDEIDRNAYAAGVANLNKHFGRIDGQVSGTEMLSGRASTDGVELCADIERIISSSIAAAITGDAKIGDEIEKIAFNSLPAHTSPTMKQITYYQLLNQVACTNGGHGFKQDYANGNMPGPHSGFPCCCYNWHAGWPKYVQHMWAATQDGGLAAVTYGPNRLTSTVAGSVPVTISQTTDYPFAETIELTVTPERPVAFPLMLRVPTWCDQATIAVNGVPLDGVAAGTFKRVHREWRPGDTVTLTFPMKVRTSTWANNSVGIERGPLAFALKIKEDWKTAREYLRDFNEYEVRPASPWNYALQFDRRTAAGIEVQTRPVSSRPFATDAAPVTLSVPARRLPGWGYRTLPGMAIVGRSDHQWTSLADARLPAGSGESRRLRVEMNGKLLRVLVDGQKVLERDDAVVSAGEIGLRAYEAEATFADLTLNGEPIKGVTGSDSSAVKYFGGGWSVRDGKLHVRPARDAKAVFTEAGTITDFVLEATVTVHGGGNAGIICRVADPRPTLDGYRGYYVGLTASEKSEDAAEPPVSPVTSDETLETVELIPFGSAKLRVAYFPVLKQ